MPAQLTFRFSFMTTILIKNLAKLLYNMRSAGGIDST